MFISWAAKEGIEARPVVFQEPREKRRATAVQLPFRMRKELSTDFDCPPLSCQAGVGLRGARSLAVQYFASVPICSPLQARREPALSDEKSLWLCTGFDLYAFSRAGQQIPGHRQLIGRVAQVFGALDVKSLVQARAFLVPESVRTQCPFFRPTTASATSIENDQRLLS